MVAPGFAPQPSRWVKVVKATATTARFCAGLPLDGVHRTDARWNKPGTQATTDTGRASRWAHYPHRRRASIRLVILSAVALGLVGWFTSPMSTVATMRVLAWGGIGVGVWAIWEKARRYVHRRELVAPLAETLAEKLKDSRYQLDPATWISVPVDVQDRPSRIYLPKTYDPNTAQETALVRLVARRIGLVNPSHHLELQGQFPYLELRPAPAPRDVVLFSDPEIRALVDACQDGQPLFGLAPRDQPYCLDLDAEAPHVGMSMATGAGKSVAGRAAIAQILHNGGIVLVLDRKIVSQGWCDGLPGVRYARTCAEIHDALSWTSEEIDTRYDRVRHGADMRGNIDPAQIGPRFLLLVEELNTLEMDMRAWWRDIRQTGDPVTPPALSTLGRFVAMGRQGRMHMIAISQKLTCQSIGGTAARENLSTRVLGRATTSTWNMLAPECKIGGRFPKMSKVRGRVHVVASSEATPVQVIFFDEAEARDYATSGTVAVFPGNAEVGDPAESAQRAHHRDSITDPGHCPAETAPADPGGDPGGEAGPPNLRLVPDPVTLSDAAERLAMTIHTLRNASKRDPGFPKPVQTSPGKPSLYRFEDLEEWARGRAA